MGDEGTIPEPLRWGEVAIIASPIAPNEAVLAVMRRETGIAAHHTVDSFGTFSSAVELQGAFDPFVAASPQTGAMFVGGFDGTVVSVHRKIVGPTNPISTDPVLTMDISELGTDKPFAAIGPWPTPHDTPEVMHIAGTGSARRMWSFHSKDEGEVGTEAPGENDPGYPAYVRAETNSSTISLGDGSYPLVVPYGAQAGRLIVPHATHSGTRSLPAVTYSDTAGDSNGPNGRPWEEKQVLATFGAAPGSTIYHASAVADTTLPTAALDPVDPGTVYVAFIGSTTDGGSGDIFIARGSTNSVSGVLSFPSSDTVRVTDDMLRPTGTNEGSTDESKPSIVIDTQRGINLLYSRQTPDGDGLMVVRYARWESFQSIKDQDVGLVQSLSSSFTPWEGGRFDYQMMCLAGCQLFAAYPTSETGTWDLYVSVIRLNTLSCQPDPNCWANCNDSTQSPILNVADFTCFLTRFAEASTYEHVVQLTHYANCDGSTAAPVVNVADFTCFLSKYAAGCVE